MLVKFFPYLLAENVTCAEHNAYWKQIDDSTDDVSCLMLATMSVELKKQYEHMDAYEIFEHLKRCLRKRLVKRDLTIARHHTPTSRESEIRLVQMF